MITICIGFSGWEDQLRRVYGHDEEGQSRGSCESEETEKQHLHLIAMEKCWDEITSFFSTDYIKVSITVVQNGEILMEGDLCFHKLLLRFFYKRGHYLRLRNRGIEREKRTKKEKKKQFINTYCNQGYGSIKVENRNGGRGRGMYSFILVLYV